MRERGTHQALLAEGGLYRTLYELQYAEQEGPAAQTRGGTALPFVQRTRQKSGKTPVCKY